ncbi:hypothetical protein V5O48_004230 [Marasmius crinis-equi]|uniref:Uncharacterized protein n=1 Tax=Marasmius crinis-equi TaxID=585013 RepID=A0ABR3FR39_9AGAR
MLGIGAAQSKDPNGIAWKQNKDFENLLKRLNADTEANQPQNTESSAHNEADEEEVDEKKAKKEKKKRKREEEKEEKKKRRKTIEEEETNDDTPIPVAPIESKQNSAPVVPRHRAHRARHIAAKSFASKSAAAISEILGIASASSSSTTTAVPTPSGTLTPIEPEQTLENLTTSTKSVSDYFKERLLAKLGKSTPLRDVSTMDTDEPRGGLGTSDYGNLESDDDDRLPRGGLGASRVQIDTSSLATSSQITTSKFASMFASFTPATTSTAPQPEEETQPTEKEKRKAEKKKEKRRRKELEEEKRDKEEEEDKDALDDQAHIAKEEKKRRKEERRKAKEDAKAQDQTVEKQEAKEEKKRKKERKERRKTENEES